MSVEMVQVSAQVPKQLSEVVDAVAGLVEELAHGSNVFSAVIAKLGALNKAVEGVKSVPADAQAEPGASAVAVGLLAGRILDALVKKA